MIAMQSTLSSRPRYCRGISMPACRSCVIFCGDHERSSQMPQTWMGWLVSAVFLGLSTAAAAQPVPVNRTPDATLRSTPETVIWGYFAADISPVLRIKSGQTVKIDTVSHGGVNTGVDPVTFFGRAGIAPEEVLKDAVDIYQKVTRPKG